ncbi:MAG TPA: hypothetical protein DD724_02010 [Lactobacillus acetotolerans]|nr:hypothetical protein [Lactobacillus acetotolerans]
MPTFNDIIIDGYESVAIKLIVEP